MYKIIFIVSAGLILLIISCSKSSNTQPVIDPCAGLSFAFTADVQPVINSNCATSANCHATGSTNSGGPLTDYNKIFAKKSQIKFQLEAGLMPLGRTIVASEKNKIICWINGGAPNN